MGHLRRVVTCNCVTALTSQSSVLRNEAGYITSANVGENGQVL